jgi:gliding motility-associated-like protein
VLNQFNGCSSAATVGVQQNIVDPVADAGASSILTCAVTSLSLSGIASGNSQNLSYLWTTTGGNISSGANTLAPTVNQPGAYLLTVTDEENGCTAIDQVQIGQDIVPPAVIIASPGVLTCTQTEVAINAMASDAGPNFTPQWATSNGNILSGVQALSPLVNQPGLYSLTISNSENGCVATSSVQVTQDIVPPAVDAGDGFTLPCFEDIAYLQGSASAATGNLGLQWSTTNGQLVLGQNTLSPAISSGGTYLLFVVNQVNGCTASDEVLILENFPANPQYAPEQPLCYEDKGLIEILGVSGGTPPYVYSVNGGATFQSSPLFVNLNAGLYSIVVQDALGCETTPESQPIVAPNPVIVDLDGIVQLKLGESYQLQVLVNFPENEIQQITWTPSEGLSCDDCLTPTVTPTQSTQYRVEVIDQNGCYGTASVQFILDKRPAVFVPNIFSPNGDGENDVFFINAKPESVRQIKSFLVFSRWGESVFEYFNFQPNNPAYGWDGTHRGRPLDPAVFVWFAEIEFIDGRTELFEGGVTLIR